MDFCKTSLLAAGTALWVTVHVLSSFILCYCIYESTICAFQRLVWAACALCKHDFVSQHEKYTRSEEDDLHLGLLDMQTENYNPEMAAIIEEEERVAAAGVKDDEEAACEAASP